MNDLEEIYDNIRFEQYIKLKEALFKIHQENQLKEGITDSNAWKYIVNKSADLMAIFNAFPEAHNLTTIREILNFIKNNRAVLTKLVPAVVFNIQHFT